MDQNTEQYKSLVSEVHKDSFGKRKEYIMSYSFLEPYIIKMLQDERDLIMVYLIINIVTTTIPMAFALYFFSFNSFVSHLVAVAYVVINLVLYLQRYILMLHYSEHRKLFKKDFEYLNYIIPYILSPFYGVPSGVYKLHHCVMHHLENNVFPWDVSSTEPYQRDTIFGYISYWLFWLWAIWILTPYYLIQRKKWSFFKKCIKNLFSYIIVIMILYKINSMATIYVFLIPVFYSTLTLSFGNFCQHIFINPENPKSNFGLAYNCVNCPDNLLTFNDGYHIVHHISPLLHWSELPDGFLKHLEQCNKEDALTFNGIGFFDVGFYVVTGQLNKLAKHYVPLNDKYKTEEDIVKMFKHRLQRIYN